MVTNDETPPGRDIVVALPPPNGILPDGAVNKNAQFISGSRLSPERCYDVLNAMIRSQATAPSQFCLSKTDSRESSHGVNELSTYSFKRVEYHDSQHPSVFYILTFC